jgi:arylsulfatase A-like enzyme
VAKNILFIMADQLRFDYLSCTGHPHLHTPNIDRLAAEGVRFDNAYVQSPVCGSSRMCFYTGRYMQSHGATWNGIPLKVGEMTMGDYLRPLGMRTALVGKTHMRADTEGMARLGIEPESPIGVFVSQCGFEPYCRDDGLHGLGPDGWYHATSENAPYQAYLRENGYEAENPWSAWGNAVEDNDGNALSGWLMENCRHPARVPDEHSETPWTTRRAMDFIREAGDDPWCLHLSYIKPHWPYVVPAPYHNLFGPEHVLPVVRSEAEKQHAHPVFEAFMGHRMSTCFAREGVREVVVPVYMGLIKQLDDQLGVLFAMLEQTGRMDDTMIVMTSDHGDYLGDHWLGEKDLFHEPSVKVPMIIRDPSATANATRGSVCSALVESIDLAATFLDVAGGEPQPHRLEGLSLLPWLHGQLDQNSGHDQWRQYVISEYDYGAMPAGARLNRDDPFAARLFMIFDGRYKLTHCVGHRPMLFDLQTDANELTDLGDDAGQTENIDRLMAALHRWGLRDSQRQTRSPEELKAMRGKSARRGINLGYWELADVVDEDVRDFLL